MTESTETENMQRIRMRGCVWSSRRVGMVCGWECGCVCGWCVGGNVDVCVDGVWVNVDVCVDGVWVNVVFR